MLMSFNGLLHQRIKLAIFIGEAVNDPLGVGGSFKCHLGSFLPEPSEVEALLLQALHNLLVPMVLARQAEPRDHCST